MSANTTDNLARGLAIKALKNGGGGGGTSMDIATQAEAIAGINNTNAMTPLRTKEATQSIRDSLATKVDKVTGKSLVEDTEITKLGTISTGATKVEQSATNGNIIIDTVEKVVYTLPANTETTTGSQTKVDTAITTLKDGVATDGDTLLKLRALISGLQTLVNSNDVNLDTLQEIVTYIKDNKTILDGVTTNKVNYTDIVDNLLSIDTAKPLSANQGKVLNGFIDGLAGAITGHRDDITNPHGVTKAQVGLPNVDNTPDAEKNVLSASKLTTPRTINGVAFDGTKDIEISSGTNLEQWQKDTLDQLKPINIDGLIYFAKEDISSPELVVGRIPFRIDGRNRKYQAYDSITSTWVDIGKIITNDEMALKQDKLVNQVNLSSVDGRNLLDGGNIYTDNWNKLLNLNASENITITTSDGLLAITNPTQCTKVGAWVDNGEFVQVGDSVTITDMTPDAYTLYCKLTSSDVLENTNATSQWLLKATKSGETDKGFIIDFLGESSVPTKIGIKGGLNLQGWTFALMCTPLFENGKTPTTNFTLELFIDKYVDITLFNNNKKIDDRFISNVGDVTKAYVDEELAKVDVELLKKVDKTEGMGLSNNNYVDQDKLKVTSLIINGIGNKYLTDAGTYKDITSNEIDMEQIETPTFPLSGRNKIYFKPNNKAYMLNSAGVEEIVNTGSGVGTGDVTSITSSLDNQIPRFDSTTGKLIQNSTATIDDAGNLNIPTGAKYKINGTNLSANDVGAEPTIDTKNTAFNQSFETDIANIKMDGVASLGVSPNIARADHVHPSDTTKAPSQGVTAGVVDLGTALVPYKTIYTRTIQSDSSVLINSTIGGFRVPIMSLAQRKAIASPVVGLEVYQSDESHGKYIYSSGGWTKQTNLAYYFGMAASNVNPVEGGSVVFETEVVSNLITSMSGAIYLLPGVYEIKSYIATLTNGDGTTFKISVKRPGGSYVPTGVKGASMNASGADSVGSPAIAYIDTRDTVGFTNVLNIVTYDNSTAIAYDYSYMEIKQIG